MEVQGDELVLPDGTVIKVRVTGKLPRACDPNAPVGADVGNCLESSPEHGCAFQTFRVGDTFEPMELGPPKRSDQNLSC